MASDKTNASPAGTEQKQYHVPHSVEELTQRNVQTIASLEKAASAKRTRSDVIADAIAGFCGTMVFIWVHVIWFAAWIVFNVLPRFKHIAPFPFQLLTLITSLEAILLTTFIMISQNRQGRLADRRNALDLQINLLAEQENSKLLAMMEATMEFLGVPDGDPEVQVLEKSTRPDKMMEQIEAIMDKKDQDTNEDGSHDKDSQEDDSQNGERQEAEAKPK